VESTHPSCCCCCCCCSSTSLSHPRTPTSLRNTLPTARPCPWIAWSAEQRTHDNQQVGGYCDLIEFVICSAAFCSLVLWDSPWRCIAKALWGILVLDPARASSLSILLGRRLHSSTVDWDFLHSSTTLTVPVRGEEHLASISICIYIQSRSVPVPHATCPIRHRPQRAALGGEQRLRRLISQLTPANVWVRPPQLQVSPSPGAPIGTRLFFAPARKSAPLSAL
jgi:hypothetical protein